MESSVAGLGVGNRLHSDGMVLATGTPAEAETAPLRQDPTHPRRERRGGVPLFSFVNEASFLGRRPASRRIRTAEPTAAKPEA